MIANVLQDPAVALAHVPVAGLVLLVVLVGAALSVARGLAANRRELVRFSPMIAVVVGGTAAVWARTHGGLASLGAQVGATGAVIALVAFHLALETPRPLPAVRSPWPETGYLGGRSPLRSPGRVYVVVAVIIAGALLAWHLTTFAASTLVWESPVTTGFGEAFYAGVSPLRYALSQLVWNEGLVSNGNASFLYGAPTYALLTQAGFSTLSLRLFATLAALLLVVVLWLFAYRHFGPAVGAAVALVASLNTYVIFYGKYGTSLAATLLTCVAAALTAGELIRTDGVAWWHGPVAGLALFVATLHYSPGRLVVIVLLVSLAPSLAAAFRRRLRVSLLAFAGLAAVLASVVIVQFALGAHRSFFHARGEQLFTILDQPDYIRDYLARDVPAFNRFKRWAAGIGFLRDAPNAVQRNGGQRVLPHQLSASDRLEVAFKVLADTVPQCNRLLSPFELTGAAAQSIFDDPPSIKPYFAPFAAFTLLGFAASVRRFWRWEHAVLLAWFAVTVAPVLLTTRLDAHRILPVAVPLCIWTALGLVEARDAMRRLTLWEPAQLVLGWSLAGLLLIGTGSVVLHQEADGLEHQRVLVVVGRIPGPVAVGALIDDRQRAWIELGLLERTRRDRTAEGRMLTEELREAPMRNDGVLPADILDRFQSVGAKANLILAPADPYRVAAGQLRALGLSATEVSEAGLSMWLIPRQPEADR